MTFQYNNIVPWGRNFDEYVRMFDLQEHECRLKILGCGDGPASFNHECRQRGGRVVSVDPIYACSRAEIEQRIRDVFPDVLKQAESRKEKFVWTTIRSVEELGAVRMAAMTVFLNSYEEGKKDKRYIPASLPELPFADNSFDLALSSHFLFLYSENLSYEFHEQAVREMLRVAREARIFPLLDMEGRKSPYVDRLLTDFKDYDIEIRKVNYEFQAGGNEVFVVRKARQAIRDK